MIRFFVIAISLFQCYTAIAQNDSIVRFYVEGPRSVALNEQFSVVFKVENVECRAPQPPAFKDFEMVSGPDSLTIVQWAHRNMIRTSSYTYALKPKREGIFQIGKATIKIAGMMMESNDLTITVTAAVEHPEQLDDDFSFSRDTDFTVYGLGTIYRDSLFKVQKKLENDIVLQLLTNKDTVYRGEMVIATYKFGFRVNVVSLDMDKEPTFPGFSCNEAELDSARKPVLMMLDNGKQYNTVDLIKYNLYPENSGPLVLEPARLHIVSYLILESKSKSAYDRFFETGKHMKVPFDLKSNDARIVVKELPKRGRPEGFTGAVGSFNLQSFKTPEMKKFRTGEKISFTVTIKGTGNLRSIRPPEIKFPPSFKVLGIKINNDINDNSSTGLSGLRKFTYTIIPNSSGDFIIGEVSFSYFDPVKEKYLINKLPGFSVNVSEPKR